MAREKPGVEKGAGSGTEAEGEGQVDIRHTFTLADGRVVRLDDEELQGVLTVIRDNLQSTLGQPGLWEPPEGVLDRKVVGDLTATIKGLQALAERQYAAEQKLRQTQS
jgi:hypothetical protein